jgi:hypothetical protein
MSRRFLTSTAAVLLSTGAAVAVAGPAHSKFFSDAAATDASRKKLVSSCIDMYINGNLPAYNGHGGPGRRHPQAAHRVHPGRPGEDQ